jgi:hypothetical protein
MANRSQAGLSDLELAAIQILVERELTAAVKELRREKMNPIVTITRIELIAENGNRPD